MFDAIYDPGHGEQGSLPPTAGLGYTVDWFLDAANTRSAVCTSCCVAGRRVTVHNFVVLELALQVRRDKIPASHPHVSGVGNGS
eukprot:381915-Pleurochrysis_carterae.AAC.1